MYRQVASRKLDEASDPPRVILRKDMHLSTHFEPASQPYACSPGPACVFCLLASLLHSIRSSPGQPGAEVTVRKDPPGKGHLPSTTLLRHALRCISQWLLAPHTFPSLMSLWALSTARVHARRATATPTRLPSPHFQLMIVSGLRQDTDDWLVSFDKAKALADEAAALIQVSMYVLTCEHTCRVVSGFILVVSVRSGT